MEDNKKEELKQLLKKSVSTDHFKDYKKDRNINNTQEQKIKVEKPNKKNKRLTNIQIPLLSIIIFALLICIYLINKQNSNLLNLEEKIASLNMKSQVKVVQAQPIIKEKKIIEEKEVIKEIKIVDKNLTKKKFKEFYNSAKFKKLTCYDYKAGAIQPSRKCLDSLHTFLEENKNALRIEIIAVVDKEDKALFDGIENVKLKNYSTPQRLKKYALRGLSRDRVLELTWNIKQIKTKNIVLTPTNYFVESQKNNKGVIIKAYY